MASAQDADVAMFGHPNAFARQYDFWDAQYEGRRLVSVILGTASGAQQVGSFAPLGLGSFIAPGAARVLRGPGGGKFGRQAAQGTLGTGWRPGPIVPPAAPAEDEGGPR